MVQRIVVDEGNLRAQGQSLQATGQDFQSVADRLKARLQGLEGGEEPPWGSDDLGEKFGVVYEGLRDGMRESMDSLATRLGEIGLKLRAMADNHAANEGAIDGRLHTMEGYTNDLGVRIGYLRHPQV
jgi:hypothetical protein